MAKTCKFLPQTARERQKPVGNSLKPFGNAENLQVFTPNRSGMLKTCKSVIVIDPVTTENDVCRVNSPSNFFGRELHFSG